MSELSKRRTFAIISHPDAGKTTVTEKLLLYGGAIKTAGSVKARKADLAVEMFSDLMLFNKERTAKQAVGFYFAFLLILMLAGGLASFLMGGPSVGFEEGYHIGWYFSVVCCLTLSFIVLYQKGRLNEFGLVLLALLSGVGAVFLGASLGLVFTAYLTTKEIKSYTKNKSSCYVFRW